MIGMRVGDHCLITFRTCECLARVKIWWWTVDAANICNADRQRQWIRCQDSDNEEKRLLIAVHGAYLWCLGERGQAQSHRSGFCPCQNHRSAWLSSHFRTGHNRWRHSRCLASTAQAQRFRPDCCQPGRCHPNLWLFRRHKKNQMGLVIHLKTQIWCKTDSYSSHFWCRSQLWAR